MLKKLQEKKSELFEKTRLIEENDAKMGEIKRKRDFETEDGGFIKKRKVSRSEDTSEESSSDESDE